MIGIDQQHFTSPPQSHVGSLLCRYPEMTAAAQPTPFFTVRAPAIQFSAQAPHSIQLSRLTTSAFLPTILKTLWGQTSIHIRHPVHLEASYSNEATFRK